MSTEHNKAIPRRVFEEVFNKENLSLVDELFATNFVQHVSVGGTQGIMDREGFKQSVIMLRNAFHSRVTIEDEIAEGDKVVIRWTAYGTHTGQYLGIPATGRSVTYTGIGIARIADGKIVELWVNVDQLGLMQQLGVIPPPGQRGS